MDTNALLWLPAVILVITGLAGLAFPALPGVLLLLAGLVVAAWAEHFVYVGWGTISILALFSVFAYGVDFLAGALGAKRFGASKRAILGAALGGFIGIFFGLPGIFLGPFLGSVLGELSVRRDLHAAGRAGVGAWLGLVVGTAAKIAIAFTMLGIFVLARFL
ncbi:MAG: DUF456 domain-containing protein [Thermodesulfobacteriota bacterium]|nr:DUF456 domain-containing protein [Thermodesulfobacteriota bacterium]